MGVDARTLPRCVPRDRLCALGSARTLSHTALICELRGGTIKLSSTATPTEGHTTRSSFVFCCDSDQVNQGDVKSWRESCLISENSCGRRSLVETYSYEYLPDGIRQGNERLAMRSFHSLERPET